jgi:hypothetical protein
MPHRLFQRSTLRVVFVLLTTLPAACTPVPEGSSSDNTLILRDSGRKIRRIGSEDDGTPRFSAVEGRHVTVAAVVVLVDLIPGKSESYRVEDEHAWFRIEAGQSLPSLPGIRFIQLWFDRRQLLLPRPFVVGEKWEFVISETGDLLDRRPLKSPR